VRYGGNTSCVEVSVDGTTLVLDAGTGIRGLGAELLARGERSVHLLLTHLHLDHLEGLRFFGPLWVEGATVTSDLVVHPGPTVGFRIETPEASFAYLPDHEPALAGWTGRTHEWISGAAIAEDADILLHDAQYFEDEYADRIGWGHSSVADAVGYAEALGARRLVLFHHEPAHSDESLERLETEARAAVPGNAHPPELAREGMVIELP
jgi:ribonuclease BN (tRNA processing enzyme)